MHIVISLSSGHGSLPDCVIVIVIGGIFTLGAVLAGLIDRIKAKRRKKKRMRIGCAAIKEDKGYHNTPP